jgi:hypothetical protein
MLQHCIILVSFWKEFPFYPAARHGGQPDIPYFALPDSGLTAAFRNVRACFTVSFRSVFQIL